MITWLIFGLLGTIIFYIEGVIKLNLNDKKGLILPVVGIFLGWISFGAAVVYFLIKNLKKK